MGHLSRIARAIINILHKLGLAALYGFYFLLIWVMVNDMGGRVIAIVAEKSEKMSFASVASAIDHIYTGWSSEKF